MAAALPPWSSDLEDTLCEVYHAAPPREAADRSGPSEHAGLEAVYRYIKENLLAE
jgi:hypothetical protein